MKQIKTFLSIKKIASLEDLDIGEIGILKNRIYLKKFDCSIKELFVYDEQEGEPEYISQIYGIRVYYTESEGSTEENIEYVLIERHIKKDGSFYDIEKIGDSSGLSFSCSDNVINNGLFLNLEPFKSMTKETIQITEEAFLTEEDVVSDAEFTKLPVFFKNKERTKTITLSDDTETECDYYLISEIPFDDFYPVESHYQNNEYKDVLYLESDWRQQEKRRYIDKTNPINNKFNCCLIDDFIFYGYLYYIYMIKTKSFHPFSEINPSKKSIFIKGATGFSDYEGYSPSMNASLSVMRGGDTSELYGLTVYETARKYKYYLILSNGTDNDDLFKEVFHEDCVYNINGNVYDSDQNVLYVSLVVKPKFNPTTDGFMYFFVSEILEYQKLDDGRDEFISTKTIYSNSAYPYIIKTIPYFYSKENSIYVNDDGYIREDLEINNNSYTDSGNFCIDNIKNILPVCYNSYIPFSRSPSSEDPQENINESIRVSEIENYNNIINSGSASGLLKNTSLEKQVCFSREESFESVNDYEFPYFYKNKVNYCNYDVYQSQDDYFELNFKKINGKIYPILFIGYVDNNPIGSNVLMRSKNEKLNQSNGKFFYPSFYPYSDGVCYYYKALKYDYLTDTITFNWLAQSIYPLTQPYFNYCCFESVEYSIPANYGQNFFVSRMVCY